jgi:hypothetical protein
MFKTLTGLALESTQGKERLRRREAAFKDALTECRAALKNVLGIDVAFTGITLREFRFNGAEGWFDNLTFTIEGMVFLFAQKPSGGYYDDRLTLWQLHNVGGFHEVLFSLAELGDYIRSLREEHPGRVKAMELAELSRNHEFEEPYDSGAWGLL